MEQVMVSLYEKDIISVEPVVNIIWVGGAPTLEGNAGLFFQLFRQYAEKQNISFQYAFSSTENVKMYSKMPEFPQYTLGDVTENGTVQLDDAMKALQAYTVAAGQAEAGLSEAQSYAADVDGSGGLTLSDAQHILRYYTLNTLGQANADWVDIVVFGA